jgi:hypothetical protein
LHQQYWAATTATNTKKKTATVPTTKTTTKKNALSLLDEAVQLRDPDHNDKRLYRHEKPSPTSVLLLTNDDPSSPHRRRRRTASDGTNNIVASRTVSPYYRPSSADHYYDDEQQQQPPQQQQQQQQKQSQPQQPQQPQQQQQQKQQRSMMAAQQQQQQQNRQPLNHHPNSNNNNDTALSLDDIDEIMADHNRRYRSDSRSSPPQQQQRRRSFFDTTFDHDDDDEYHGSAPPGSSDVAYDDDDLVDDDDDDDDDDGPLPDESKYTRAIQYLAEQDNTIQLLKQQLHGTKLALVQCQKQQHLVQQQPNNAPQQQQRDVTAQHINHVRQQQQLEQRLGELEEKLRTSMSHNQENEVQLVWWKRRTEQLEQEKKQLELQMQQKVMAAVLAVEQQWRDQLEERLQVHAAESHREQQVLAGTVADLTAARDAAESSVSRTTRELVLASAESERWKKEAQLWKKRTNEADMLRTQLSAVRAVLGNNFGGGGGSSHSRTSFVAAAAVAANPVVAVSATEREDDDDDDNDTGGDYRPTVVPKDNGNEPDCVDTDAKLPNAVLGTDPSNGSFGSVNKDVRVLTTIGFTAASGREHEDIGKSMTISQSSTPQQSDGKEKTGDREDDTNPNHQTHQAPPKERQIDYVPPQNSLSRTSSVDDSKVSSTDGRAGEYVRSQFSRSHSSSLDSRVSVKERRDGYTPQQKQPRNEEKRRHGQDSGNGTFFPVHSRQQSAPPPRGSTGDTRGSSDRRMRLSIDHPSFDAPTTSHSDTLHTAPLNRGSNDTEDDEMQELIQQLNSMKETLSLSQSSDDAPSSLSRRQRLFGPNEPVSLSHSSETIEPPQVQRPVCFV